MQFFGECRDHMLAAACEECTQDGTDSGLMTYYQFLDIARRAGFVVSDPPTADLAERYIAYCRYGYPAQGRAAARGYLLTSSIETYYGSLCRDMAVRHSGFDLREEAPRARRLLTYLKKEGTEMKEKQENRGEPVTPQEMLKLYDGFVEQSKKEKKRNRKWNALMAARMVGFSFSYVSRVCEVATTRYGRKSSVKGLEWEQVIGLDEDHNIIAHAEWEKKMDLLKWMEVLWGATKMKQVGWGDIKALHVSGQRFCIVRLLADTFVRVRRAHRAQGYKLSDTLATPVFTMYDGTPFMDYTYRTMYARMAEKCKLPKEKRKPHVGLRAGGRTAAEAAKTAQSIKDALGGWVADSKTAKRIYERTQRERWRHVHSGMLSAIVDDRQSMRQTA